jgi:hypothetical protein
MTGRTFVIVLRLPHGHDHSTDEIAKASDSLAVELGAERVTVREYDAATGSAWPFYVRADA